MKLPRRLYRKFNLLMFCLRGKRPWSRGYTEYKEENIRQMLARSQFTPAELGSSYGFRIDERIIEYPWLFSRLPETTGTFLDAGSVLNFEYILEHPALTAKKLFISTLAPEAHCFFQKGISYIYEDLRRSCFQDEYFDWIASLSTIEHVGMDNTMLYTDDQSKCEQDRDAYLDAVCEFRRLLKPGGVLYLTIPFGKHVNHDWFQVFDAGMVDRIIKLFAPTSMEEFHFRYEPKGWLASTREASRDATCFDIHKSRSYDSDFAAFSRAVVCLELVK